MNPPTPYPAAARSKSRNQNEFRETAFHEITARTNAVSKSAQDPFTGVKKRDVEQTGKGASKTPTASRRYSVASKFAGPKTDNLNIVSCTLQSKPKLNKRASFQGATSEPQSHVPSALSGPTLSRNAAVPSSKKSVKATTVPSLQGDIPEAFHRRQSLASGQSNKPHKACTDLSKRPEPGCRKAELMQAHQNKTRGLLLKSACYWMEQVKLAETLEKYGVSIGFFRLAVECGAEPIDLLRQELIAFIERYSLWSDTIQQLLLCYGVTIKDQNSLFSRLAISGTTQSSPCTPGVIHDSDISADKEHADQVCQKLVKSLDQNFNETGKDSTERIAIEVVQAPDEDPVPGHIKNMDAESITREVVSCIMSSMNHNSGCSNGIIDKCLQHKSNLPVKTYEQNNHILNFTDVAKYDAMSALESISNPTSAFEEEATSSESLPSLNAWNTMPKETATATPVVQEQITLVIENDINDSTSTSRVSGEGMCVSMELVDTLSDDLQSSNQTCSSGESNFEGIQATVEVHGSLLENPHATQPSDQAISSGELHSALTQSSTHEKSQNQTSRKGQTLERCGGESSRDSKCKKASSKIKIELSGLQMPRELEVHGIRRMNYGSSERHQNVKEKSTPVSITTTTESPASSTDKAAALATLRSKRLSVSTPRSSTAAQEPNLDTISKARRKSKPQGAMQDNESHQVHLTNPAAELEEIVATPSHDWKDEEGSKQISVLDSMGMGSTIDTDPIATPGSAGVRRSARLIKPAVVSTPSSVSTHPQRRLQTPKKA